MRRNSLNIVQTSVLMERLEERQFMSVSVGTSAPLSHAILPAITAKAKAKILGPSAVEGTYDGKFTIKADGQSETVSVVFTITSTTLSIDFDGVGTYRLPINSKLFRKLREGTFSETKTVNGETVSVLWTVYDSGNEFRGTFTGSGKLAAVGSFKMIKVS
jgi:hypothetical protein